MSHIYMLHGLTIDSSIPLHQPIGERERVDVTIVEGSVARPAAPTIETANLCANEREIYIVEKDVGRFTVRDGREIVVEPCEGVDQRRLRYDLCSLVLPLLLHQRGSLVLHATTVAMHDEAIALIGMPGEGKSTLALALCDQGAAVVAEDVTVVRCNAEGASVAFPGESHLLLSPDAIHACGHASDDLPHVFEGSDRRVMDVPSVRPSAKLPLTRIYRLEEGPSIEVALLSPREALTALIGNPPWYWLIQILDPVTHRALRSTVAANSPLYSLRRPRNLELLYDVAEIVMETPTLSS